MEKSKINCMIYRRNTYMDFLSLYGNYPPILNIMRTDGTISQPDGTLLCSAKTMRMTMPLAYSVGCEMPLNSKCCVTITFTRRSATLHQVLLKTWMFVETILMVKAFEKVFKWQTKIIHSQNEFSESWIIYILELWIIFLL